MIGVFTAISERVSQHREVAGAEALNRGTAGKLGEPENVIFNRNIIAR